jgi:hypothetical protein
VINGSFQFSSNPVTPHLNGSFAGPHSEHADAGERAAGDASPDAVPAELRRTRISSASGHGPSPPGVHFIKLYCPSSFPTKFLSAVTHQK